uniref:Putative membrane protein At1g16860 n=1 Tax=Anthurium amnicola TaxID=1678845 RepID=A0A1D1YBH7_9ARAE
MNDLSGTVGDPHCHTPCSCWCFAGCAAVPRPVLCVVVSLLVLGLAVSAFILAIVHNAVFLVLLLALSALVLSFLVRNAYGALRGEAALFFLDRFPDSDLCTAKDGDVVKVSGWVSCGNIPLQSSYEKAPGCVYASTLLYEYKGYGLNELRTGCFCWKLAYSERFTADFHLTDIKSGIRVMVKAGYNSKVTSLIKENILVRTTGKSGSLSSTLMRWLEERHLSTEARLLRLEEGYVKEGSHLTVMGMVNRCNDTVTIIPLLEPISTGCLLQKLLLPMDVDGLILKYSDNLSSLANPHLSQNSC